MDVSDVLRDRMQQPAGLQRMVTVSFAVHAIVVAVVLIAPKQWMSRSSAPPTSVMTISLGGGGEGPRTSGMTSIGGRPVQVQTPPEETPKREAVRPPAAKVPEMTLPTKANAKPTKATSAADVKEAPDQARGRTPTKGAHVRAGSSIAETGARGEGFGLSSGGGPGTGSRIDVADFCCPEYVLTMVERIRSAWVSNQGATGECTIKFTIQRDGRITSYEIERSSGSTVLDLAALRAVANTKTLPPLPAQYQTLPVHLNFQYQ